MLGRDNKGRIILFADVPNSGGIVQSQAASGNKAHDSGSGKFTSASPKKKPAKNPENANVDPNRLANMLAAVRDASRLFPDLDQGSIEEFLQERAKEPSAVDIERFMAAVRSQRISDLTDIIHQTLSEQETGIKLTAPQGFVEETVSQLTAAEVQQVSAQLVARGHAQEDVDKALKRKSGLNFSDEYETDEFGVKAAKQEAIDETIAQVERIIAKSMSPRKTVKTIIRGENGLVERVEEEEVNAVQS